MIIIFFADKLPLHLNDANILYLAGIEILVETALITALVMAVKA